MKKSIKYIYIGGNSCCLCLSCCNFFATRRCGHYIIVAAVKLTTISVYCNNLCVSVSVSVCVQSALNKSSRNIKIEKKKNPSNSQHIRVLCVVCRLCLDYENISQLQSQQQQQQQQHCNILHAIAWRKGLSHTHIAYKYDSLGYLLVSYWIWIDFVCFFSMDCNHFISYEMLANWELS